MDSRERLIEELRPHALVIGEVTLTSGAAAQYYVDAKRAILRPAGFAALGRAGGRPRARVGRDRGRRADDGRRPPACAALAGGADVKAFFVRKETKAHGLQRRIEGPLLERGERCLIVEDVVTTGGSTVQAIEAVREAGLEIGGVVRCSTAWRAAPRRSPAAAGAPYEALATIDDVYPERPDRALSPAARGAGHAPSRIRTCGLLLRRESLYPAELSGPCGAHTAVMLS